MFSKGFKIPSRFVAPGYGCAVIKLNPTFARVNWNQFNKHRILAQTSNSANGDLSKATETNSRWKWSAKVIFKCSCSKLAENIIIQCVAHRWCYSEDLLEFSI